MESGKRPIGLHHSNRRHITGTPGADSRQRSGGVRPRRYWRIATARQPLEGRASPDEKGLLPVERRDFAALSNDFERSIAMRVLFMQHFSGKSASRGWISHFLVAGRAQSDHF